MNAIEVVGLRKAFGQEPVLTDLDLGVPFGAIYGLLGRNGAGKSTLLKTLIGLLVPDRGEALVLGGDLSQGTSGRKHEIGYVAQGEILPGFASIRTLMEFESSLRPTWDDSQLRAWLDQEKLLKARSARTLSVGQRKRLELELVFAGNPSVLLMDEPLAGLDPVSRAEIVERIVDHAAESDRTILISSHIIADLERLCDRIGVMTGGRVALQLEMEALKSDAAVITAPPGSTWAAGESARIVALHEGLRALVWIVSNVSQEEAAELRAEGWKVTQGSLEDLATALIRGLER